jgi:hypothetical protein
LSRKDQLWRFVDSVIHCQKRRTWQAVPMKVDPLMK